MSEPTTEQVRQILRDSLGLTGDTDLKMQHELMRDVLQDHWVEEPGPPRPVAGWETSPFWEMSFVGDGGQWSIVARALAKERVDALVVLVAERLEELDRGVEHLTAVAGELLMYGRARIYREGDA